MVVHRRRALAADARRRGETTRQVQFLRTKFDEGFVLDATIGLQVVATLNSARRDHYLADTPRLPCPCSVGPPDHLNDEGGLDQQPFSSRSGCPQCILRQEFHIMLLRFVHTVSSGWVRSHNYGADSEDFSAPLVSTERFTTAWDLQASFQRPFHPSSTSSLRDGTLPT